MEYPDRVRHLVLVDPWGFNAKPPDNQIQYRIPAWVRAVGRIMTAFNPLSSLRAAGPFGKKHIKAVVVISITICTILI